MCRCNRNNPAPRCPHCTQPWPVGENAPTVQPWPEEPLLANEEGVVNASLVKIAELYHDARLKYRDRMIDCGRMLHAWLLFCLKESVPFNSKERRKRNLTHRSFVEEAAVALGVSKQKIRTVVAVAVAVDLLGDGRVGDLGIGSLCRFTAFLDRVGRGKPAPQKGENRVLCQQEWKIREEFAGCAKETFARAVAESWPTRKTREEMSRIMSFRVPKKHEPSRVGRAKIRPQMKEVAGEGWMEKLRRSVAHAGPKDVAMICMDMVKASEDPDAVKAHLLRELAIFSASKKKKPALVM
jgi:hypothetical protein